ncbi:MAG: hypothetical protein ACO218_00525 [Steroidobacteraceae bacterium]
MIPLLLSAGLAAMFMDAYFAWSLRLAFYVPILILCLGGAWALRHESRAWQRPPLPALGAALSGAAAGHLLVGGAGMHAALAGSLAGSVASALPFLGLPTAAALLAPFYVGVFAGTSAEAILHGAPWAWLAGLLAGLIWAMTPQTWSGIGGKMGLTGFLGAAAAVFLSSTLAGNHPAALPAQAVDLGHELAIPLCGLSAVITRLLATRAGWSIVAASALPTALFSLLTLPMGPGLAPSLAAAWFAGSFVGMTHPSRIASLGGIATVGAVLGILLLGLQTTLVGWGGVLGASACACVLGYISLEQLKK